MGSRYREISLAAFQDMAVAKMGFSEITEAGTGEYLYERAIDDRFRVRVYSSVDIRLGVTRDSGEDAIRVTVYDGTLGKPVWSVTCKRTENALTTMRERCRDAWAYVKPKQGQPDHKCTCGALMVERKAKGRTSKPFLGCTSYPVCKNTREIQ